ncbi:MAG: chorismate synthase [Candidatus Bathyarchaeota archaeon]|nr:MAG: chorismate synthase [Candidatus Bathyarchaeota archaeon]
MSNSLGRWFRVTSFGESHGRCVGVVVDGCPAGLPLEPEDVQQELDRRKPGQSSVSTGRAEDDRVEILSGVFRSRTTGAPICMLIWNLDRDSSGYEERRWTPRPGHADWTAHVRYGGFNDYRGGGRFSGRITAGYVMAGAVAKKLLASVLGVEVLAHSKEIGGVEARDVGANEMRNNAEGNPVRCADPEAARLMEEAINEAASDGDSVGGAVECIALNVPPGVGSPVFDTLEGDIAKAFYAIPAVKAVEFGLGKGYSSARGSAANDGYTIINGRFSTETNNAGGILGGLSSGMPIRCLVTFKPTPSIGRSQRTVDVSKMVETTIEVGGRHDPCIVPRAVPVVEGMVSVVLADHALGAGLIPRVLGGV